MIHNEIRQGHRVSAARVVRKALSMSRPRSHPKRVPDALLAAVGTRETKWCLDTQDRLEAKRRPLEELTAVEVKWMNLLVGPRASLIQVKGHSARFDRMAHWLIGTSSQSMDIDCCPRASLSGVHKSDAHHGRR